MEEQTPYADIKTEVEKLNEDALKKEYEKLTAGQEYEISKVLRKGIIEGYRPKNHPYLIFNMVYGNKYGKYRFLKEEMEKNTQKKIKYKKGERTIEDLFKENCREIEILREYQNRFLPTKQ